MSEMEKRMKDWETSVVEWSKVDGTPFTERELNIFRDAFRKGWISADRHYNPPFGKKD